LTSFIWCGALFAPLAYKVYLRDGLKAKVVYLTPENHSQKPDQGGGTGFHIIAPSGKVYIMTNRHVCNDAVDGKLWAVVEGKTSDHQVKVIYASDSFDLCLVEAIPGVGGLTVGDAPNAGDNIYYLGHPRLQQDTFVAGEAIGYHQLVVTMGVIGRTLKPEQCKSKDEYAIEETELQVLLNGFQSGHAAVTDVDLVQLIQKGPKVKVCYEKGQALVTTLMIYAGASGSPMVDSFGKLIGVVYAAPVTGGWGYGVTLADIKQILNGR